MRQPYNKFVQDLAVPKYPGVTTEIVEAALGLSGECGEVVDLIKKSYAYQSDMNVTKLQEELGDLIFYAVSLMNQYGLTLGQVIEANRAKLVKRYPNGYNDRDAIRRADKATPQKEP